MQRSYLKFIVVSIILFTTGAQSAFSQNSSFRLRTADSLFNSKRYTQSIEHYEEILKQKQYTPAMLLKMAYVKEGLLQIGPALYYLNLYYIATRDKTALEKMNELASKYNLEGYETSEADNIISYYHDYHLYINAVIGALMILMLSFSFYTKFRLKKRPIIATVMLAVFAVLLMVNLNYGEHMTTGIVASPSTYIMSGPSAAASVIEIIGDGHRVTIIGEKDVWLKVRWNDADGYIKQNALLPVEL